MDFLVEVTHYGIIIPTTKEFDDIITHSVKND